MVFRWLDLWPSSASKGRHPGILKANLLYLLIKLDILWIRAGPPPLNVMDPKLIKLSGHKDLVFHGKGYLFGLGAVSKTCIVYFYSFHRQDISITVHSVKRKNKKPKESKLSLGQCKNYIGSIKKWFLSLIIPAKGDNRGLEPLIAIAATAGFGCFLEHAAKGHIPWAVKDIHAIRG